MALAYTLAIFYGVGTFLVMGYSLTTGEASDFVARAAALHFAPYSWGGAIILLIEQAIAGFIIGLSTPIVSNFFLGQGPWTLFQAIAWGLMGASSALIGKFSKKKLIIFGFVWGMLYGWILNLWFWTGFVFPLNLTTFILANANSFPFDVLHALTNALLFAFFGEKVNVVLERFKQRFNVQRI